jgi:hypothetical protein
VLYTVLYMAATRTQVYLTAEQRRRLDLRRKKDGRSLAALVREALDAYLVEEKADVEEALRETFGTLPSLKVPPRKEWDRA